MEEFSYNIKISLQETEEGNKILDEIKTLLTDIKQARIGEAVSRILKLKPDFPIENAQKTTDTRNRIIHGYDSVFEDIIWLIAVRDIPNLEKK